ncbi:MAG: matrixin family metalloprotease [Thaumarchaeota archaeon]|nr:matrixin family metalloprotease [Nitrososphaerota archaeon]
MRLDQSSEKSRSIKELRDQLLALTRELNNTTEKLQVLELITDLNELPDSDLTPDEIGDLIKKRKKISHEIIAIKKRIQKLSAKTILKTELVVLPLIAVLLFYGAENQIHHTIAQPNHIKTRYLIENLAGNPNPTYKYWNIAKGIPLTVSIVNPNNLNQDKISVVKKAILSTQSVEISNLQLGTSPSSGNTLYFKGWQGALDTINNTRFNIPTNFHIVQSIDGPGQIVITLSDLEDPDGYSGYTRSIVDNSQILKSYITIYDAGNLSDHRLAAIVRHEFGHALGLPHTSDAQDLMHAVIETNYPYVSPCDIKDIQDVYDGNPSPNSCSIQ